MDSEVAALRQQNRLLEVQLQSARDFQGAVLDTIYWALGGVFLAPGAKAIVEVANLLSQLIQQPS